MEKLTAEFLKDILLKNEYQCHLKMEKKDYYTTTTTGESVKDTQTVIQGAIFINIPQPDINKIEKIINKIN